MSDVDNMIERENEKLWEEQEKYVDPLPYVKKPAVLGYWSKLHTAKHADIDHAIEWLAEVAGLLRNTAYEDRLNSICNDLAKEGDALEEIVGELHMIWRNK